MHNDSRSQSTLVIHGTGTGYEFRYEGRFQSLSLIEELPELDADGDGLLSDSECQAGREWILGYLSRGLEWGPEGGRTGEIPWAGETLTDALATGKVEPESPQRDGFGFDRYQWVRVSWEAGVAGNAQTLSEVPAEVAIHWFQISSPGHRDRLTYTVEGHVPQSVELLAGQTATPLQPGPALWQVALQDLGRVAWTGGGGLALCVAVAVVYGRYRSKLWPRLRGMRWAWLVCASACALGLFLVEAMDPTTSPVLPAELQRLASETGALQGASNIGNSGLGLAHWALPIVLLFGMLDQLWATRASLRGFAWIWGLALAFQWHSGGLNWQASQSNRTMLLMVCAFGVWLFVSWLMRFGFARLGRRAALLVGMGVVLVVAFLPYL